MRQFLVVLCIAAAISNITANDYCSSNLCDYGQHVACGHNGEFSYTCPADAAMVPMTDSLKHVIVDGHNAKRNFIAGGGDVNHKPACRMATMQWDDELAYFASLNVKKCQMNHDSCSNTADFHYTGQNLAWMGYFEPLNSAAKFNEAIEMWYSEVAKSKQEYMDSFPSSQLYSIGHFSAMMTDRNIRVGCAASTYSVPGQSYKAFLVACNYAAANMPKFPIYVKCDWPASQCSTGNNPSYPNLCSVYEQFDVNYGFN
ncbi:antigen 5 like allergen Cul n 1-like [Calliphora vicina]|uniref:antigen 5 like allergen Cul n 1-like n=1 Tax=Calliphora vicina TaxID=7373 RepID=UPI00325AFF5A